MFEWLKKLCGRAGKPEPAPETEPEPEPKPTVDHLRRPLPDLLARQSGQKRNRYHVYEQPYGYPIRRCDWVAVELSSLDDVREIPGKEADVAIQILKGGQTKRVCSHCLAIARGRQSPPLGMLHHGHGKGAPLP